MLPTERCAISCAVQSYCGTRCKMQLAEHAWSGALPLCSTARGDGFYKQTAHRGFHTTSTSRSFREHFSYLLAMMCSPIQRRPSRLRKLLQGGVLPRPMLRVRRLLRCRLC